MSSLLGVGVNCALGDFCLKVSHAGQLYQLMSLFSAIFKVI